MAGVDFAAVRDAIPMASVLELLKFVPDDQHGSQLRGSCPVHGSQNRGGPSFSVNLAKNAFRCFKCGAAGNQLDLWAKVHGLSLFDAAVDLCKHANIVPPGLTASIAADTEKRNP
jgi:DNA primase